MENFEKKWLFSEKTSDRRKFTKIFFRSKNYRKITKIIFLRYERYFGSVVVLEELNIFLGAVIGTKLVHPFFTLLENYYQNKKNTIFE